MRGEGQTVGVVEGLPVEDGEVGEHGVAREMDLWMQRQTVREMYTPASPHINKVPFL